jgi:hypothetical protein
MLNVANIFTIVLVLNVLWFGAAFWYFGIKSTSAAKILAPRSERENVLFPTLAWSAKFLGGMNLAFSVFALVLLLTQSLFPDARQNAVFALIFALAHCTQFAFNVPLALAERNLTERNLTEKNAQKPLWQVLQGPMRFIFIVDGTLTIANLGCGIALLLL